MWQVAAYLLIGQVPSVSPAVVMRDVHSDLKAIPKRFKVDEGERAKYRYLVRKREWSDKEWSEIRPVIVGWLNHLCRSGRIFPPESREAQYVGEHLIRVDVYEFDFQKVFDQIVDPYFTETQYRDRELGSWLDPPKNTKWYRQKIERVIIKNAPAQILMDEPGDEKLINQINDWTYSSASMVSADYFMNLVMASVDRFPAYNDFLGFQNEKDFQRIVGFDEKLFRAFKFEVRDAVGKSAVTLGPRAIVRWDSAGTAYWKSIDFLKAEGDDDPLTVVGIDIERNYTASEQFGFLPNRLWAVGAFTGPGAKLAGKLVGAGKVQTTVPTEIASHPQSGGTDVRIHQGWSCFACHGSGGLRDLRTWHRNLYKTPLRPTFLDYSKRFADPIAKEKELNENYRTDLIDLLEGDRLTYERSLKRATGGLTSKVFAERLHDLWKRYEFAEVDAKYAAAQFGLTEKELKRRLDVVSSAELPEYLKLEPRIGFLLQGETVGIRQWEPYANQTWKLIRGVK